jgi:tetratricopeptide (TPR) repeat protein
MAQHPKRTAGSAADGNAPGFIERARIAVTPDGRGQFLLGALLFMLVAGVFLPALTHGFITYDDPVYVTENPHVAGGLTWANVCWAFRSTEASNWHPLTWLSHMVDGAIFGLHPWGHHLTNVILHAINAVLLFVALRRMTGAPWRSLFVAALFGLHPLHVEAVAWVSERKEVLSSTFWMLVLWAYARRAELARDRRPGAMAYYGWALLFFALGLMCKPMLVTLPFVLLLLDYWPLNRWKGSSTAARWALLAEKVPFLALSAAASAVTLFAQGNGGAVGLTEDYPWPVRLGNALVAYCRYLGKCFYPAKLAVFYPYFAEQLPLRETLSAGLLLAAVTVAAAALVRQRPYLMVGWLWFVGTLVPVIGLVQVGAQSLADRYTYVSLTGVFIMATWAAADISASWPHRRRVLGVAAGALLAGLASLTCRQLGFWKDGASLFRHTLAVTQRNWVAHANLFATLSKSSSPEASAEFQETVRILAGFAETYDKKGLELARTPGRLQDAIREFRTAVRIMPDMAAPHLNLGMALARIPGGLPEATDEFRTAARLEPGLAEAHYNLGTALAGTPGGQAEAIAQYEAVVRLRPDSYPARFNLAALLSRAPGREGEAIAQYQAVIGLRPDFYQAHFNLGLILSGMPGRRGDAMREFGAALKAKPDLVQAREMIDRLQAAQK